MNYLSNTNSQNKPADIVLSSMRYLQKIPQVNRLYREQYLPAGKG